ncbi:MAG: hypothetical protein JXR95_15180 [Deltaproteobacteria bacterium]|nr:hypothetical protein [Deltaproteobacteria bacterium]
MKLCVKKLKYLKVPKINKLTAMLSISSDFCLALTVDFSIDVEMKKSILETKNIRNRNLQSQKP